MPFWAYMLHCRDRTFYTGLTDDLDARIAQHQDGSLGGYTAAKRPVVLVWSQEFATRCEALSAERQIKGWGRKKKLALIRGDWAAISVLAKGKERPSTDSGRAVGVIRQAFPPTVRPEPVEGRPFCLFRHPTSSFPNIGSIHVLVRRTEGGLRLRYVLRGDTAALAIPPPAAPERRDELWRHTCFELFVKRDGEGYEEFNFSPSGAWASYRFTAYREGVADLPTEAPIIRSHVDGHELRVDVAVPCVAGPVRVALTAVIQDREGGISYWALAHPPEGPPDFHHPAGFVLELPGASPQA